MRFQGEVQQFTHLRLSPFRRCLFCHACAWRRSCGGFCVARALACGAGTLARVRADCADAGDSPVSPSPTLHGWVTLPSSWSSDQESLVMLAVIVFVSMAVVMVFVVPMTLMHLPALLIVIVVRMVPVGPLVGWLIPATGDPSVVMPVGFPVAVNPCISATRSVSTPFKAQRGRRNPDVNANSCEGGKSDGGAQQQSIYPLQSHNLSPLEFRVVKRDCEACNAACKHINGDIGVIAVPISPGLGLVLAWACAGADLAFALNSINFCRFLAIGG